MCTGFKKDISVRYDYFNADTEQSDLCRMRGVRTGDRERGRSKSAGNLKTSAHDYLKRKIGGNERGRRHL